MSLRNLYNAAQWLKKEIYCRRFDSRRGIPSQMPFWEANLTPVTEFLLPAQMHMYQPLRSPKTSTSQSPFTFATSECYIKTVCLLFLPLWVGWHRVASPLRWPPTSAFTVPVPQAWTTTLSVCLAHPFVVLSLGPTPGLHLYYRNNTVK